MKVTGEHVQKSALDNSQSEEHTALVNITRLTLDTRTGAIVHLVIKVLNQYLILSLLTSGTLGRMLSPPNTMAEQSEHS